MGKAEKYEEALRRILAITDDNHHLYQFCQSDSSKLNPTSVKIGTHDAYQEVRRIAAWALNELDPSVKR